MIVVGKPPPFQRCNNCGVKETEQRDQGINTYTLDDNGKQASFNLCPKCQKELAGRLQHDLEWTAASRDPICKAYCQGYEACRGNPDRCHSHNRMRDKEFFQHGL
jgi:hypothetical protein